MTCPRCGGRCDRDEIDTAVGTWGCPACHWLEGGAISTEVLTISGEAIAAGLYALGEAYAVQVGARTFEVYERALAGRMTEAEWREVVELALEVEERWCSPAVLLRLLRQLRRDRAAEGPTEDDLVAVEAELDRREPHE